MIKCAICGKEYNILSNHIKSHGISKEDYLRMYPDSRITSDEYKEMMSERNKSDKMRSITIQRNKSDKMRKLISDRNRDKNFIEKCKSGYTEEVRAKRSEVASSRNKRMWKDEKYRSSMSEKISRSQKIKMNTEERKKFQSNVMKKFFENNPDFAEKFLQAPKCSKYAKRGTYESVKFGKVFNYKSHGELEFVKLCESIINPSRIDYEVIHIKKNGGGIYTPDFLLSIGENTYLVEIKYSGSYKDMDKDKLISAIDYCENNGIKFVFMTRFSDIKDFTENSSIEDYVLCRSKIG